MTTVTDLLMNLLQHLRTKRIVLIVLIWKVETQKSYAKINKIVKKSLMF